MNHPHDIPWTRTTLEPLEREGLLRALQSEQKAHLLEHEYVWVEGAGVLWKATDGALRRSRFTHGTHFRTQRGEFYIDSEGSARELATPGQGFRNATNTDRSNPCLSSPGSS